MGLLLSCNVVVYETEEGAYVAAMDPLSALGLVDNEAIGTHRPRSRRTPAAGPGAFVGPPAISGSQGTG